MKILHLKFKPAYKLTDFKPKEQLFNLKVPIAKSITQEVFELKIKTIEKLQMAELVMLIAKHRLVKKQASSLLRFAHCILFKGHH